MNNGIFYFLRRRVMSVPLLYRLYVGYFDKRNSKRDLPKPADRYFVDGYPRSGNTFTKGLIRHCFPGIIANNHFHCIAPIKMALGYNQKVLILFRDPLECVSSLILMENYRVYQTGDGLDSLIELRLKDYIVYYEHTLDNFHRIQFLPFEKVISDEILYHLDNFFELPFTYLKLQEFREINHNVQKEKSAQFSMLPNAEKDKMKKNLKEQIHKSNSYCTARQIFELLNTAFYESTPN